jgi:hypothetical protein
MDRPPMMRTPPLGCSTIGDPDITTGRSGPLRQLLELMSKISTEVFRTAL